MRGASTLIPARFLALVAHLCVAISLLWETELSAKLCSWSRYRSNPEYYQSKLLGGFAASVALILLELITFMLGLTMFSSSISLLSIACHGGASIILTYFILDGWLCEWFWPIFSFCSVLPSICDTCTTEQKLLEKPQPAYQEGWSLYLILAGLATTLGCSLPVGYNIGVVNTPAEIIKQFCNESIASRYNVVLDAGAMNILWSSIVSIFIIGGCTGSLLGSLLANSLGRKKATLVTNVLSIAGAVCFYFSRPANSVEMLLLGRLLVGLSAGLTTSIVPMYLTELAGPAQAGAAGVLCPMGVNVGVLVGQLMGLPFLLGGEDEWPSLLAVYALLVIVCLPIIFILPESPKYLYVVKGLEETASEELSRLRGVSRSVLTRELDTLQEERIATLRATEGWGLRQVIMDPRLRLPILLAASGMLGQQTSGINAVFYYSSRIFQQAGLSRTNAQYATIGCGFINVCTCVIMIWLLPLKGRRPLILSSTLSAAVLLLCLALSMLFMSVASWMSYVCVFALLAYVLVYGFGLGPIPYFIASELFEVGPRPGGMALGSLANWGGNFLVGMTFPTLNNLIGPYCFLIFAAITMALYVFLKIYFPETKNKTPAQVAKLCSRGFKSRPLQTTPIPDAV